MAYFILTRAFVDFMLTTDMIAEVNKFGGKSECSKLNGAGGGLKRHSGLPQWGSYGAGPPKKIFRL